MQGLFTPVVRILLWGLAFIFVQQSNALEQLQKRACRIILDVNYSGYQRALVEVCKLESLASLVGGRTIVTNLL